MTGNGSIDPELYRQALAAAESLEKSNTRLSKSSNIINDAWDGIASNLLGVSSSDFIEKMPKSAAEMAEELEKVKKITQKLKDFNVDIKKSLDAQFKDQKALASQLSGSFKSLTDIKRVINSNTVSMSLTNTEAATYNRLLNSSTDIESRLNKFADKKGLQGAERIKFLQDSLDLQNQIRGVDQDSILLMDQLEAQVQGLEKIEDKRMKLGIAQLINSGDMLQFIKEFGDEGVRNLAIVNANGDGQRGITEEILQQAMAANELANAERRALAVATDLNKETVNLEKGFKKIGTVLQKNLLNKLGEFDQAIHDLQTEIGSDIVKNTDRMTDLVVSTAEFGMSIGDTTAMMNKLSGELHSIDANTLIGTVDSLKAVQKATGASMENITAIAGELMRAGNSAEHVEKFMENASSVSHAFGVSTKKVLDGIAKHIDKYRTFGYTEGEKSLTRMVAQAERLRMNVDDMFASAEKMRTLEGAISSAADLQLAGGSFANANPMDLIAAARKGPAELQKILAQMGSDIGAFNEKTGTLEFDAIDSDRLKIVSDATGQSMESLTKMIQKNAQDSNKAKFLGGLEGQIKSASVGLGELDDELVKSRLYDMIDKDGKVIKGSLLSKQGIDTLSQLAPDQLKNILLEDDLKNKNLKGMAEENQSLKDSWGALTTTFLNLFTVLEPVIIKLTDGIQWLVKALQTDLGKAVAIFLGAVMLFGKFSLLNKVGRGIGSVAGAIGLGGKGEGKSGSLISRLFSKGTNNATPPVPTTGKGGGKMSNLVGSISKMKINMGNVLMFAAAIAIIAGALFLVSKADAISLDQALNLGLVTAELGSMVLLASLLGSKIDFKSIVGFGIAMALVGAALIPAAYAASLAEGVDTTSVMNLLLGLVAATGILMMLGTMLMGPQIGALFIGVGVMAAVSLTLAGAMWLIGKAAIPFGDGMERLSKVNWSGLGESFAALTSLAGGLMALSLSFFNPLMIAGMAIALVSLSGLSVIMTPLSDGLTKSSTAMGTFASNVGLLKKALDDLDTKKLEDLKNVSNNFVASSVISKIGSFISGDSDKKNKESDRPIEVTVHSQINLDALKLYEGQQKVLAKRGGK